MVTFRILPLVAALCALAAACGRGSGGADDSGSSTPALFAPPSELPVEVSCGRAEVPTILESLGGGLALFDGDDDGDLDLVVAEPGPYPVPSGAAGRIHLLENGGGGRLVDVSERLGAGARGFFLGAAVADVDADGDRDLFLCRYGTDLLLRNDGQLAFGVAYETPEEGFSTSAVFFDADQDGDLDLYVVHYVVFDAARPPMHGRDGRVCLWNEIPVYCGPQGLEPEADVFYRNEDGRLSTATQESGFDVDPAFGLGALEGDFDEDGLVDLYVSNDSMPNFLFRNRGGGRFEERGLLSGCALSGNGREQAGMGIAAGDADQDGDEDLVVTNFSMDDNAYYVNEGGGFFREDAAASGLGAPTRTLLGWGSAFLDVDLDGDLDLVCANGHVYPQADAEGTGTRYAQPDLLFLNDGGRFRRVAWSGDRPAPSRALAVGDLDGDRLADLVVLPRSGRPWILRSLADPDRALRVRVRGPAGNPDGVGTRLVLVDDRGRQLRVLRTSGGFQAASEAAAVFAFRGPAVLEARFPDGRVERLEVAAPGEVVLDGAGP